MKDYSDWEPSARLGWWVKYFTKIVWVSILMFYLVVFLIYWANRDVRILKLLLLISFPFLFCLGQFGGWNDNWKKFNRGDVLFLGLIPLAMLLLYYICITTIGRLYGIILDIILAIGLTIAFFISSYFYKYFRKYAREFIPRYMYYGKSQWQVDVMESKYARLQFWYVFRVQSVFLWMVLILILLPFIKFNPS